MNERIWKRYRIRNKYRPLKTTKHFIRLYEDYNRVTYCTFMDGVRHWCDKGSITKFRGPYKYEINNRALINISKPNYDW